MGGRAGALKVNTFVYAQSGLMDVQWEQDAVSPSPHSVSTVRGPSFHQTPARSQCVPPFLGYQNHILFARTKLHGDS